MTPAFSEKQQERFIMHLADCHSWYKHLSLNNGGHFKITIDINAGQNYPTQHPALPFGNSFEEYQKAFGQLVFFWKNFNDTTYSSDGQCNVFTDIELKDRYKSASHVVLFPYISNDFVEAINFHESDFKAICNGSEHEEKATLTDAYYLHLQKEKYWQTLLTDKEKESIISDPESDLSPITNKYLDIEKSLTILLLKLRLKEIEKIKKAIDQLRNTVQ